MYSRALTTTVVVLLIAANAFSLTDATTYPQTRKLLSALTHIKDERAALAALFKQGDARIDDLSQALQDPDRSISLRAQVVIRYLGNEAGMNALEDWYRKQIEIPTSGPIPLPLRERDYESIRKEFITQPVVTWDSAEKYIYALALESSPRARAMLNEMMKRGENADAGLVAGEALRRVKVSHPEKLLIGRKDLARLVLRNAFFIAPLSRRYTSARLLGFNGVKDKALVEVYVNHGPLAEEWHHVVISKHGRGWRFFSITRVSVS